MPSGKARPYKGTLLLIITLLSPIIFLGIPTKLAFTETYLEWYYRSHDLPPDRWGMSKEDRLRLAKIGLRSVLSKEGMEELKKAKLPNGKRAFNNREVKHMYDVQTFLYRFFKALYLSIFLYFLILILIRDIGFTSKALIVSSLFSLTLFAVAGTLSYLFYTKAFELFHNFFFDPVSWRFRDTDTLLRIYPMKLWFDSTMYVLLGTLSLCLLSFGLGVYLRYKRWS